MSPDQTFTTPAERANTINLPGGYLATPMALISLGVAFLKGSDSYAFLYALADVMAVLSGVFYPLAVFPKAVQTAVQVLPTTHAFDLLKAVVGMAEPHPVRFFAVAGAWLVLAVWFNRWAFQKARKEGRLVRMK